MITLIVGPVYTKIDGIESPNLLKEIIKELTYEDKTNLYSIPFWARNKCSTRCLYNKKTKQFPTGVLQKVLDIIDIFGYEYKIIDKRKEIKLISPIEIKGKKLRDYQIEAINKIMSVKNGILSSCTGSGKTVMFIAIMGKFNGYKQLVIVRKQLLFIQTIREIETLLGIEVGYIGAGKYKKGNIMVAMAPSLARIIDSNYKFFKIDDDDDNEDDKSTYSQEIKNEILNFLKNLDVLIVDECHAMPSQTMITIAKMCNASYRYGFTATPFRNDGLEILMFAYIGQIIHKISASDLIKKGMLIKPKIHFINNPKPKEDIFEQNDYYYVYNKYIVNNYQRNKLAIDLIKKAYSKNEKIVVLVKNIDHGNIICNMLKEEDINAVYIHGEHKLEDRIAVIDNFRKSDGTVIVSSSIPYHEYILIKNRNILELIQIGEFIDKYMKLNNFDVECCDISRYNISVLTFNNNNVTFNKINKVIRHKNHNKIVKVKTNNDYECLCTDNHSLIGENNKKIKPKINEHVITCEYIKNNIKYITINNIFLNIFLSNIEKLKDYYIDVIIDNNIKTIKVDKYKYGNIVGIFDKKKNNYYKIYSINDNKLYYIFGYIYNNCIIENGVIYIKKYKNYNKLINYFIDLFLLSIHDIIINKENIIIKNRFIYDFMRILFNKENIKNIILNSKVRNKKIFLKAILDKDNVHYTRDDYIFLSYISLLINQKICFNSDNKYYIINNCDNNKNNNKNSIINNIIEEDYYNEYVYDISVENTEKFFVGNGILAHNSILDEGVDIPEISVLVILGGGKSKTKYYQQIGRALRLSDNKNKAIIIDFLDHGVKYLESHAKKRLSALKDEELFEVIKHI